MLASTTGGYSFLARALGIPLLLSGAVACAGPLADDHASHAEGNEVSTATESADDHASHAEGNQVSAATEPAARLDGIDVSEFQGDIDWQAAKAAGVVFAFARALEGDTIHDSQFAANWQGMKEAGVVRGAYDFYIADDSPETQVEEFTALVTLEPGDLVPMVDIESASLTESAPANLVSDFHRYLDLMEAHYGVKPIIYTDPDFWNENLDDSFGEYPLWVADYDGEDTPTLPEGWDDWVLWQHTDLGSVPGIDGDVDLDVFKGGLGDLARYRIPEPGQEP